MHFDTAQCSHPGARQENEDAAALWIDNGALVAIVADGLGGHGHGRRAAECVVNSARAGSTPKLRIEAAQRALHAAIGANPEYARMRSTAVILEIRDGDASWAHCGDARLYAFREGTLAGRTLDHSVPQRLALAGEISDDDIRRHEDRNRLLSALGEDRPKLEATEPRKVLPGDAFLLASDGFWEHFTAEELESTLRQTNRASAWLDKLQEIIQSRAGENQDNYTAIAIRLSEEAQAQP